MKIQSHNFDAPNESGMVSKVATGVAVGMMLVTGAHAADPQWFTDLNTQVAAIAVMVGTVLTGMIGLKLVPIAWDKIKPIISR